MRDAAKRATAGGRSASWRATSSFMIGPGSTTSCGFVAELAAPRHAAEVAGSAGQALLGLSRTSGTLLDRRGLHHDAGGRPRTGGCRSPPARMHRWPWSSRSVTMHAVVATRRTESATGTHHHLDDRRGRIATTFAEDFLALVMYTRRRGSIGLRPQWRSSVEIVPARILNPCRRRTCWPRRQARMNHPGTVGLGDGAAAQAGTADLALAQISAR